MRLAPAAAFLCPSALARTPASAARARRRCAPAACAARPPPSAPVPSPAPAPAAAPVVAAAAAPAPGRRRRRRRRRRAALGAFWGGVATEAAFAVGALAAGGALLPGGGGGGLGPGFFVDPAAQVRLGAAAVVPFVGLFGALSAAGGGVGGDGGAFRALFERRSAAEVAVFCVAAAVGEELLFRGVVQAGVAALFHSQAVAVVVASVVFGALHAHGWMYSALATLAGGLFGALYISGGESVLPGILVHAVYDAVAIGVLKIQWTQADVTAAAARAAAEALIPPPPLPDELVAASGGADSPSDALLP